MKKILQTVITTLGFLTCINFFSSCENVTKEIHYITQVSEKTKTFDVKVMPLNKKQVDIRSTNELDQITTVGSMELGFIEGKDEIPYCALTKDLFVTFFSQKDVTYKVYEVSEVRPDTTEVTIKNKFFNTSAVFDLKKHTLTFENYDVFFQKVLSDTKAVPVYLDVTECDTIDYLEIREAYCTNIPGRRFVVDWSNLDIDVVIWNNDGQYNLAIPVQMFSDVFCAAPGNTVVYNGKNLYLDMTGKSSLLKEYYENGAGTKTRSQALSDFCYNELCLNLDINYGLKSIHGLDEYSSFDSFFTQTGIKKDLTSVDALTFASALYDIIELHFDDGHSTFQALSHLLTPDTRLSNKYNSQMDKLYKANLVKYRNLRNEKLGITMTVGKPNKGAPAWTLSSDGKTLIVRFDSFMRNTTKKEQITEINDTNLNNYVSFLENEYDTISLIHTVNKKIKETPSIENVVLDLSCNGGGDCAAGAVVLYWMLGESFIHVRNQTTGAKWTTSYQADINKDGDFNDDDTIKDKNLFCLISPLSFSCGNMVPAMLKAAGVTIMGARSSGGSCCVGPSCTADGTLFNMSSKYRLSERINGSFYDIDRGIEPHINIKNPADFYDVEKIDVLCKKVQGL